MMKPDGTHIVGIDLGTTFSLVSDVGVAGPLIIPNAMGDLLTPSAVSIDEGGTVLIGAAARARAARFPESSAVLFKRDMGTAQTYRLGDQIFTPVELSALILGQLKRDAEATLGAVVSEAVITVPAYFGEAQRQATRDAARLAGLIAERIINEPTAAALAYGFHRREGADRIVVLDLGGGTFDVTVLQITGGVIEVTSSSGDTQLGGEDFTRVLVEAHAQRASLDLARPVVSAVLTEAAERLKRGLSHSSSATVATTVDGAPTVLQFSRVEAERLWRPLLDRMTGPIRQALADAELAPRDAEQVLLVGGATRMPVVSQLARGLFEREPRADMPQDESVALGAAVQAALKIGHGSVEELVATDIAPFSLGVATTQHVRRARVDGVFVPILERGTVLPASRVERFSTLHPMQSSLEVEVFQGEHSLVERNTRLGALRLDDLPVGRINDVDIRFSYDLNGILEVETTTVATGQKHHLIISRSQATLAPDDVEAVRRRFALLKIHPRETLPNRTALETAETLFMTLLGEARTRLSAALAEFRLELEAGDRHRIEQSRSQLLAVVHELRR
jgi:molecular chaperone HscC